MQDQTLHLRLSSDTRRQIERQAQRMGTSLSDVVRRAIQAGLEPEQQEEQNDDNA
jgi:Arc/MetJ-type ribon-helix-helix transcriptional regulator